MFCAPSPDIGSKVQPRRLGGECRSPRHEIGESDVSEFMPTVRRENDIGGGAWNFYASGKEIAVHTGPAHFDDLQAWKLYDIKSGRVLKTWSLDDKTPQPDWATP